MTQLSAPAGPTPRAQSHTQLNAPPAPFIEESTKTAVAVQHRSVPPRSPAAAILPHRAFPSPRESRPAHPLPRHPTTPSTPMRSPAHKRAGLPRAQGNTDASSARPLDVRNGAGHRKPKSQGTRRSREQCRQENSGRNPQVLNGEEGIESQSRGLDILSRALEPVDRGDDANDICTRIAE